MSEVLATRQADNRENYLEGIDREALHGALSFEIGCHVRAAHEAGNDTPGGEAYMKVAQALFDARDRLRRSSIDPDVVQSIEGELAIAHLLREQREADQSIWAAEGS